MIVLLEEFLTRPAVPSAVSKAKRDPQPQGWHRSREGEVSL
jgi:hypothetical protein